MKYKRKRRASKLQKTDETSAPMGGIPMKYRKFPKSFWQQPNRPNKNLNECIVDRNEILNTRTGQIKITSAPDTNLLFSLFKILKQDTEHVEHVDNVQAQTGDTCVENHRENKAKTIAEDEDSFKVFRLLDDPLMSPEEDCRGLKKSLKSSKNYSELLSDLVVNL